MGTLTVGPFGTYTGAVVATQAAQDEIIANLNSFKALIPEPGVGADGTPPAHPDFGMINPATAEKLRAEIDAMITVIDAMPVA